MVRGYSVLGPAIAAVSVVAITGAEHQNPVSVAPSSLKVLKISAGPSGSEKNGVFTLSEERSIFSRTTDREVIVFFQWEGTPGPPRLVAHWRSPDGAVSSTSTVDYLATDRRFGAFWPLYLSSTIALGTWTVEATVDGQPAGRYTFDVRDEKVEAAPIRAPLSPTELYEKLNRAFVVIERFGTGGKPQYSTGGFVLGEGRVYSAASTLDGVDALHVLAPDRRVPVPGVRAWNRGAGWAILLAPGVQGGALEIAAANATKIGDRLFTIEGTGSGSRLLRQGIVGGEVNNATLGRRLLVSFPMGGALMGSPVVDEFGALVGMMGGPAVAGVTSMLDVMKHQAELNGYSVIPFSSVRPPQSAAQKTLAELQAAGELAPPLAREENVVSGGFARSIMRSPAPRPSDQRESFSTADQQFVVFVNWTPVERLRGETRLVLFNEVNQPIAQSPPRKSTFRKGEFVTSYWELPVPRASGTYRADVLLDNKPIWRGFVRITP